MQTRTNHTTELRTKYVDRSVKEFLASENNNYSAFLQTKLALAGEALLECGKSYNFIARKLQLASPAAARMMIHTWGSKPEALINSKESQGE